MSLSSKIYFVTGSTDGIGRHTASRLLNKINDSQLIIHGRNEARVQETIQYLGGNDRCKGFIADFSDLQQVHKLADDVKTYLNGRKLTALVNNAGVFASSKQLSKDNLEMTYAVNVAAPFLLTSLLLDCISERIVNVASISAASSIDFNNLQQERGFSSHNAYSNSKLCNILFSFELAERLAQSTKYKHITSNALDPGTVNTKMLFAGWGPIGIDLRDANDEYFVTTDESLESATGKYFVSSRERRAPQISYDAGVRRKLWELLEEQTGAVYDF